MYVPTSSSPVETLHTILLGVCKYALKSFMTGISKERKRAINARVSAFNTSGLTVKMYGNVCYYYNSFVGRDYKGWMQMAIFILLPYLSPPEKEIWFHLSKVGRFFILILTHLYMNNHM